MNRIQAAIVISAFTVVLTSCGGSSPRVLESISISPNLATAKNGSVQLIATGTFSSSPVTVTPLPVVWTASPCDNLCNATSDVIGPISVNSQGLATCPSGFAGTGPVSAYAPKDPSLPLNTPKTTLVWGATNVTCP